MLAYQAAARGRDVGVGAHDDATGTASLWGRLTATDAALLSRRLEAMARSVCRADPRTLGERRSDAIGILAAGGHTLPCRCTDPGCPLAGPDARADAIVIHVLTDHHPDTPTTPAGPTGTPVGPSAPPPAPSELAPSGPEVSDPAGPLTSPPPAPTAACPGTAVIAGGAVIPAALLAELRVIGATTTPTPNPHTLGAEPRYRPSTRLARPVRTRA